MKTHFFKIALFALFLGARTQVTHAMHGHDVVTEHTNSLRAKGFPIIDDTQKIHLDSDELQLFHNYCCAAQKNLAHQKYFLSELCRTALKNKDLVNTAYARYVNLVAEFPSTKWQANRASASSSAAAVTVVPPSHQKKTNKKLAYSMTETYFITRSKDSKEIYSMAISKDSIDFDFSMIDDN